MNTTIFHKILIPLIPVSLFMSKNNSLISKLQRFLIISHFHALGDHSFSTFAQFSEKITFLTPWYAHVGVRIRGKKCYFFGKCCVRTKWMILWVTMILNWVKERNYHVIFELLRTEVQFAMNWNIKIENIKASSQKLFIRLCFNITVLIFDPFYYSGKGQRPSNTKAICGEH